MTANEPEQTVASEPRYAYWWDFFGPHAERTAQHHAKHLREFLEDNGHASAEVGTASAGHNHCAAFCLPPPAAKTLVEATLRPNRTTLAGEVPR